MSRTVKLFIVLVVLSLVVGASALAQGGASTAPRNLHFIVVTHGQASDPFWSVVKNGVDQAAADMRVTVDYKSPQTFDMVAMSQLIDAAVASKPDGLVVSIPDPDALSSSIKTAIAAGIPVISINSGSDVAASLGVLAHIGQTEYDAGKGGGERMAAAGAKNALCVNQEVGNVALDQRCQGFTDAMSAVGGKVTVLAVDLSDPTGSANRIAAALSSDSTLNSIFTLGPTGAAPALQVLTQQNLLGKILLATFDLSPDVLQAISDGNVLFAIDQQQYMQGYLPIVYLTLYKENLNTPGNILIPTGPGFVTKDNAARIIELSKAGTR